MGVNFLLALLLVYLVMASLFESLAQPFAILFSIPFAIPGAASQPGDRPFVVRARPQKGRDQDLGVRPLLVQPIADREVLLSGREVPEPGTPDPGRRIPRDPPFGAGEQDYPKGSRQLSQRQLKF